MTNPPTEVADDPILAMLDSIEEAIHQDAGVHADQALPDLPGAPVVLASPLPPTMPLRLVPVPSLRKHPDPPPRSAGVGSRVQGPTAKVLAGFKWGT